MTKDTLHIINFLNKLVIINYLNIKLIIHFMLSFILAKIKIKPA